MDRQDICVSSLVPQSGEMLYLLSGSSLHSQFLWPQNCTCLLIADPGGKKHALHMFKEQSTRANRKFYSYTNVFKRPFKSRVLGLLRKRCTDLINYTNEAGSSWIGSLGHSSFVQAYVDIF